MNASLFTITMPPGRRSSMFARSAAGLNATSTSGWSAGVRMSLDGEVDLEARDARRASRRARGSRPGSRGSVERSLPASAVDSVNLVPVSCMPSPESPAKRMATPLDLLDRLLGLATMCSLLLRRAARRARLGAVVELPGSYPRGRRGERASSGAGCGCRRVAEKPPESRESARAACDARDPQVARPRAADESGMFFSAHRAARARPRHASERSASRSTRRSSRRRTCRSGRRARRSWSTRAAVDGLQISVGVRSLARGSRRALRLRWPDRAPPWWASRSTRRSPSRRAWASCSTTTSSATTCARARRRCSRWQELIGDGAQTAPADAARGASEDLFEPDGGELDGSADRRRVRFGAQRRGPGGLRPRRLGPPAGGRRPVPGARAARAGWRSASSGCSPAAKRPPRRRRAPRPSPRRQRAEEAPARSLAVGQTAPRRGGARRPPRLAAPPSHVVLGGTHAALVARHPGNRVRRAGRARARLRVAGR